MRSFLSGAYESHQGRVVVVSGIDFFGWTLPAFRLPSSGKFVPGGVGAVLIKVTSQLLNHVNSLSIAEAEEWDIRAIRFTQIQR